MRSPLIGPPRATFAISGVTTCVRYADFLDRALTANLHHFDDFVVVTSHDDRATRNVCDHHGVTCIPTDLFFEDGATFNKGLAINLGLSHLQGGSGWRVHLDADILLPDRFRYMLGKSGLEPQNLYGADRVMVESRAEWEALALHQCRQYRGRSMVEPPLKIGARIIHEHFGYCPLGFFQLWHSDYEYPYPVNHNNAAHSDLLFACQWPRAQRILLPGVYVYHINSEATQLGANWNGRTSPPFYS